MASALPARVAAILELEVRRATRLAGRSEVWHVEGGDGVVVLRRNDPLAHPPNPSMVPSDAGWVHRFLRRLRRSDVGVPTPVRCLAGESVAVVDGAVWEALTYVPGRVVGWAQAPDMFSLGAFLARFHDVVIEVETEDQRQPCLPISSLVEPATWAGLQLLTPDRRTLTASVDALADDLDRIGHAEAARSVIHGDCTNHNVLSSGAPPRPCGIIDFANAYVDATLADVGFALWRSGRPSQRAHRFAVDRIADYVAGYHSQRPLQPGGGDAVVAYLRARGLQIMAKQARRGGPVDTGPLRKLAWLRAHETGLRQRLMSELLTEPGWRRSPPHRRR